MMLREMILQRKIRAGRLNPPGAEQLAALPSLFGLC